MAFSKYLSLSLVFFVISFSPIFGGVSFALEEDDPAGYVLQGGQRQLLLERGLAVENLVQYDSGPVYIIPLRVHIKESRMEEADLLLVLEEINEIWWSQAGIVFEIQMVEHDEPMAEGFDLWFHDTIAGWNGYYVDSHEIRVRDNPVLAETELPARLNAARTAAHELGHALSLGHNQNSDNNLMRSKTLGWLLNDEEISLARETASSFATKSYDYYLLGFSGEQRQQVAYKQEGGAVD